VKHFAFLRHTPDGFISLPTPWHSITSSQDYKGSSQAISTFMLVTSKDHLTIGFTRALMTTTSGHSHRECGDGSSGMMAKTSCLQTSLRLDGTTFQIEELATRPTPGMENSFLSTFTTTIFIQIFTKSQEQLVDRRAPMWANSFVKVHSMMKKDGERKPYHYLFSILI
jgi:hypothetical protein